MVKYDPDMSSVRFTPSLKYSKYQMNQKYDDARWQIPIVFRLDTL